MTERTDEPLQRGWAVNLANNIVSRLDAGSYGDGLTDKGAKCLADAVLLMDAEAVRIILLLLSFAEDACSGYISGSGSDLKWQRERDQACTDASALLRAVGEEK